jgi:PAS domain S-box-containing protein
VWIALDREEEDDVPGEPIPIEVPLQSVSGYRILTECPVNTPEHQNRAIIDAIPTLAWSADLDGSAEFFNQRWLDYTGLSAEQARDWGWTVALHSDDLSKLVDYWRSVLASGDPGETEARLRRFDGVYRWFLFRATPSFDNDGRLVKWFGTNTDIDDRRRAECLLSGENRILEMTAKGNSLESILEAICRVVEQASGGCCCSILLIDSSGSIVQQAVAPSLPSSYNDRFPGAPLDRGDAPCAEAARLRTQVVTSDLASDTRWDKYGWRTAALKHGLKACWSTVILASNDLVLGTFAIYWREPRSPNELDQRIIGQITHLAAVAIERKRDEEALRSSEQSLRLIVDSIPGFVSIMNAAGEVELQNRQILEYAGKTAEEIKNWAASDILHPDDLPHVIDAWRRAIETGEPIDLEHRSRGVDGVYRWFHARGHPQRNGDGRIVRWYNLVTDIDDRKRAEEKLRQDERELRQLIDSLPQHVLVLDWEGSLLQANQMMLDYTGHTLEEMQGVGTDERAKRDIHPDDLERARSERRRGLSTAVPFEIEERVLGKDRRYRWFLFRYSPLLNEDGRVARWFATATDIDDRKLGEQRMRNENLALREEIDRSSMYEAIVGSSQALRKVISQVSRVAPTDSTVLISGETGTGKELIASAIHKGSKRSARAFIAVNCAAIPSSLIASELFGHEKGAFTGALQRRVGRFESADGGTIFLDEIGELSPETQIALLRVLQERKFERVGGTQSIHVDVRVVAATNRDLRAAIANGTFREDLYYRLNVFPIQMPPLRERKDDILTLLEYFVQRISRKLGKKFSKIDKRTVELFRAYEWPGNVRELQNVIERSVILSPDDVFCVDEAWLFTDAAKSRSGRPIPEPANGDFGRERQIIEAALAESGGRVYGTSGAAAKLQIPPSTLDYKIKRLEIHKRRFKHC